MEDFFEALKVKLDSSFSVYTKDLAGVRTGRASAHLLDSAVVEAYGGRQALSRVATVSVVDQKTISVQVWDKELVKAAQKGIESAIGIAPNCQGQSIRVVLPDVTEERRKELCKLVARHAESAKVASRNIRREFMDKLKKMEKDKEIDEDDLKKMSDRVQKMIDEITKKIDETLDEKEKEIMTV